MDVYESAKSAFQDELRNRDVRLSEKELVIIEAAYNFPALQKYIDNDVATVRLKAAYSERYQVGRERELYHQQNVQNIARIIAQRVALEKRERPLQVISESKSKEFQGFVKTARARGCDIYPC
jgi:hypothetical protein